MLSATKNTIYKILLTNAIAITELFFGSASISLILGIIFNSWVNRINNEKTKAIILASGIVSVTEVIGANCPKNREKSHNACKITTTQMFLVL